MSGNQALVKLNPDGGGLAGARRPTTARSGWAIVWMQGAFQVPLFDSLNPLLTGHASYAGVARSLPAGPGPAGRGQSRGTLPGRGLRREGRRAQVPRDGDPLRLVSGHLQSGVLGEGQLVPRGLPATPCALQCGLRPRPRCGVGAGPLPRGEGPGALGRHPPLPRGMVLPPGPERILPGRPRGQQLLCRPRDLLPARCLELGTPHCFRIRMPEPEGLPRLGLGRPSAA